jgi:hypothetical protein
MSSSQALYNRIAPMLEQWVDVKHHQHLVNWVWIIVGILQAKSIKLAKIAEHIPGEALAASRVTTIRRWLKNLRIDPWTLYRPVLEQVLAGWRDVEATLILDGTMVFNNRFQVYRLSLRHGCRAIPLAWVVLPGTGLTRAEVLAPALRRVADFLRPRVKRVLFTADAGFRDCDWAQLCQELHWDYVIRVAQSAMVTLADGRHLAINALNVPPGERRFYHNVQFTDVHHWPCHLSVAWTTGEISAQANQPPELMAVISNRRACGARLDDYARRTDIEESFLDDKSGGFDLAHTRLTQPERLERLLLALAIATLWCHELGEEVLATGDDRRREIDPGWQRELSLFQLGLRWLERCLSTAVHRLSPFRARLSPIALAPVT